MCVCVWKVGSAKAHSTVKMRFMGTTAGLLQYAVFHMSLVRNPEVSVCVYGKTLDGRINHLHCRSDTLTSEKRKTFPFIV